MVQHHVDLIVAWTQSDIVLAAKRAARDIPIVFVIAGDPVANGIVASMSRPGANATGLTSLNTAINAKRLELLKGAHASASACGAPDEPRRSGNE
jgi:putative ABC transport system substrate-binding protein